MSKLLILTPAQAEAIYRAMCELNNVGAYLDAKTKHGRITEFANGAIRVTQHAKEAEVYASQAAFAAAYGLQ